MVLVMASEISQQAQGNEEESLMILTLSLLPDTPKRRHSLGLNYIFVSQWFIVVDLRLAPAWGSVGPEHLPNHLPGNVDIPGLQVTFSEVRAEPPFLLENTPKAAGPGRVFPLTCSAL